MITRRQITKGLAALYGASFGLIAGCGGGTSTSSSGGGIVATGKALINGNVASSSLPGGIAGLNVRVVDQSTTTDSAGRFSLNNVPKGDQNIVFESAGGQSRLAVTVPDTAILTLGNINIQGATAKAGSVTVTQQENSSSGGSGSSGTNSGSSGSNSSSGNTSSSGSGSSGGGSSSGTGSSGSSGSSSGSGSSGSSGNSGSSGSSGNDDDDDD